MESRPKICPRWHLALALVAAGCTPGTEAPSDSVEAPRLARTLQEMEASGGEIDAEEMRALGSSVQHYLAKNAGQDPERLQLAVRSLAADLAGSGLPPTPENAAILMGTILSSMVKHVDQMDANVVQRKEILGKLAASTTELGGTTGVWGKQISEVIIGLNRLYQELDQIPSDSGFAWQLVGHVKLKWLQGEAPPGWSREDVSSAIRWLDIALRANGFGS